MTVQVQLVMGCSQHASVCLLQALTPTAMISFLMAEILAGPFLQQRVMEYFIKLIKKKFKKDISGDARALQKLRREAERAKRALSSQHQVRSHVWCVARLCCAGLETGM
jgi:hypothetical protein